MTKELSKIDAKDLLFEFKLRMKNAKEYADTQKEPANQFWLGVHAGYENATNLLEDNLKLHSRKKVRV
jgi:hypothetical protein